MVDRLAAIVPLILVAGCTGNNEQVEGIVVTLDTRASFITEVPAVYLPEAASPVEGAAIASGEAPMAAVFASRADGRFDFTILGGDLPSQGNRRTLAASATGYEPVEFHYEARPGKSTQYFMVVLKKTN